MQLHGLAWKRLTILSIVAGIIYNSWPLGFVLNPTVAHHGLASELAGVNQPYNWVFIYGDVVSSLMMLFIVFNIWSFMMHKTKSKWLWLSLGGMVIFCITASIAALCPLQCISAIERCPTFVHNPITLLHAITSVAAGFSVLAFVTGLWLNKKRDYFLALQFIIVFLIGSWALIVLFTPGTDLVAQYTFISLSSLCMAAYPWSFARANHLFAEAKISN
jgi:hypothetical protein